MDAYISGGQRLGSVDCRLRSLDSIDGEGAGSRVDCYDRRRKPPFRNCLQERAMKLSRIEANWIASKLLSDAEQESERFAQRRTAWLAVLFPRLAHIRPTERFAALRNARVRAAREPMILWPTVAGLLLYPICYVSLVGSTRLWLYWIPSVVIGGNFLAQYLRTRFLLRDAPS
jgi:hypothetical protein